MDSLTLRFDALRGARLGRVVFRVRFAAGLLAVVFLQVLRRNTVHAKDFDLDVGAVWERIGHLVDGFLVHLHAVYGQAGPGVQFLVADVTFEVLRLLVLYEDFLVVEFTVAVPVKLRDIGRDARGLRRRRCAELRKTIRCYVAYCV